MFHMNLDIGSPVHVLDLGSVVIGLSFWPALFFWALFFVLFIEIAFETGTGASVTLACAIIASWFFGLWTVDFVVANHTAFLWLAAFYLPIGLAWATAKWWLYCYNLAAQIRGFLAENPNARRSSTAGYVPGFGQMPPRVGNHKSELIRWFAWWPFSMIGSMFDDFLRRICLAIYHTFANFWQSIANRAFAGIDLSESEPEPPE